MTITYHSDLFGGISAEQEIPYKDKLIVETDSGYVKILGYDDYHESYCIILTDGFMTVEEAKALIDKGVE